MWLFHGQYVNILFVEDFDMRRLTEDQRLSHKFLVGCNQAQYEVVQAEARARGLAPTIIAREAFARGLDMLHRKPKPSPAPILKPAKRPPQASQSSAPQAETRTPLAVIKQRQAEHDELCLPYLRSAKGPTDAVQLLERAGVLSPSGKLTWDKTAVWRICRRHGISYLPTGGKDGT